MAAGLCSTLQMHASLLPLATSSSKSLLSNATPAPLLQVLLPARSSTALCRLIRLPSGRTVRPPFVRRAACRVVAQKTDIYRILGTAVKTARDVLEAGTKLVPESVPRPLAKMGVAVVGILIVSFLLKSIFSILLFVLAIGGVSYFIFFYLNKDDDQGNGGSDGGRVDGPTTDKTLEEARRIMEKYK